MVSRKYILLSISLSAVFVVLNWYEASIGVIVLSTFYYVYWAINHRSLRERIEAFFYFFNLLLLTIATFTAIYEMEGIVCSGDVVKNVYDSAYFSIVTWTTLGYGDCLPTENIRHLAAMQALVGYFMMAIFMALLFSILSVHNKDNN